jgi:hypothetical protein
MIITQLSYLILEHLIHSFIAANFVQKHNLPSSMLKNQMIVSSPGGDMHARHVCPKVNILIRGVEYIANLIVLE